VIYIFANSGAFLTTALYCLWLHRRHRTMREYVELPAGPENRRLPLNISMAVLCLAYGNYVGESVSTH
jgi:L-rhamnose-H+ transport protein